VYDFLLANVNNLLLWNVWNTCTAIKRCHCTATEDFSIRFRIILWVSSRSTKQSSSKTCVRHYVTHRHSYLLFMCLFGSF